MSIFQAIIMGIIQGVTEFLPVSSSGHLAIFKNLFKLNLETGMLFDILLHIGTLVSVFIAFRKDIAALIKDGFSMLIDIFCNIPIFFRNLGASEKEPYYEVAGTAARKMVLLIIVASIPTAILGFAGKKFTEYAEMGLLIPGICLLITAVVLFFADRVPNGTKKIKHISYLNGFEVGIVQGIATMPGISRSGSTMAMCLFLGFEKKMAVKFSFLMSIPAILGALLLEVKDVSLSGITSSEWIAYVLGMLFAAVIGYIAIKTVMVIVRDRKFFIFSIYCFAVGMLAIIGNFVVR